MSLLGHLLDLLFVIRLPPNLTRPLGVPGGHYLIWTGWEARWLGSAWLSLVALLWNSAPPRTCEIAHLFVNKLPNTILKPALRSSGSCHLEVASHHFYRLARAAISFRTPS